MKKNIKKLLLAFLFFNVYHVLSAQESIIKVSNLKIESVNGNYAISVYINTLTDLDEIHIVTKSVLCKDIINEDIYIYKLEDRESGLFLSSNNEIEYKFNRNIILLPINSMSKCISVSIKDKLGFHSIEKIIER